MDKQQIQPTPPPAPQGAPDTAQMAVIEWAKTRRQGLIQELRLLDRMLIEAGELKEPTLTPRRNR